MKTNGTKTRSKPSAKLLIIVAVCTTFFASHVLYGQSGTMLPDKTRSNNPTPLELELRKFDLNKDGKLDEAEKQAYLADKARKRADYIRKWDKNGDGQLDDEENAAAKAAWRQAYRAKLAAEAAEKAKAQAQKPASPP